MDIATEEETAVFAIIYDLTMLLQERRKEERDILILLSVMEQICEYGMSG
jgi:hypothetical protein